MSQLKGPGSQALGSGLPSGRIPEGTLHIYVDKAEKNCNFNFKNLFLPKAYV